MFQVPSDEFQHPSRKRRLRSSRQSHISGSDSQDRSQSLPHRQPGGDFGREPGTVSGVEPGHDSDLERGGDSGRAPRHDSGREPGGDFGRAPRPDAGQKHGRESKATSRAGTTPDDRNSGHHNATWGPQPVRPYPRYSRAGAPNKKPLRGDESDKTEVLPGHVISIAGSANDSSSHQDIGKNDPNGHVLDEINNNADARTIPSSPSLKAYERWGFSTIDAANDPDMTPTLGTSMRRPMDESVNASMNASMDPADTPNADSPPTQAMRGLRWPQWFGLVQRFQMWRTNLDVKFKIGFYLFLSMFLVVGLPAGVAELFHSRSAATGFGIAGGPLDSFFGTGSPGTNGTTDGGAAGGSATGNGAGSSGSGTGGSASATVSAAAGSVGGLGGSGTGSSAGWSSLTDAMQMVSVYDENAQHVVQVPLNQYIENVLAAQMSPKAPMDALESAAVVVRTYAKRAMSLPKSQKSVAHQHHADVTTSGSNDLGWLTDSQQQSVFGSQYAVDTVRLREAVAATDGLVLMYQHKPIMAFLTAISAGHTRDGKTVLGQNVPYLQPISCPADVHAQGYVQHAVFSKDQLAGDLGLKPTSLNLSKFTVTKRDKEGYALQVQDLSHSWKGEDFAARLGLPSSDMSFRIKSGQLDVTTKGEGSGLGLSLHQAEAWANNGETWQKILHTFYPGARIEPDL